MESVFSEIGVVELENEVFHRRYPAAILGGGRRSSKRRRAACGDGLGQVRHSLPKKLMYYYVH